MKFATATTLFTFAFVAAIALAQDPKPAQSKSLLDIVLKVEKEGYAPITDVSRDDGNWEVEAYKGDTAYELTISAATGEIITEHRDDGDPKPPADAKKLSEIIKDVEAAGYSSISEVSFERRHWEIEAVRERSKRELRVDPVSGKVVSDRADD